jgi:hypothetical protein
MSTFEARLHKKLAALKNNKHKPGLSYNLFRYSLHLTHPHRHSWAQSITWKNTHRAESPENEQFGQYKGSFILQYKILSSVHQAILCIVQRPLLFNFFRNEGVSIFCGDLNKETNKESFKFLDSLGELSFIFFTRKSVI